MPIKTKEVKEDKEYLNLLVTGAQDTNYFLSNKRKPERERRSCAAFLRCLGVSFTSQEITSAESDPPDVIFRSARIEVLEILDQGRKRHDEWKMELQRSKTAKAFNDLLRPYKPREPLPYIEIVKLITEALAKKAVRYGYNVCADLDALVYVNLLSNVLDPNSSIPNTEELVSALPESPIFRGFERTKCLAASGNWPISW